MVDIQSATTEKRGKKKKKPQDKNIMACPIPYGSDKKYRIGDTFVTTFTGTFCCCNLHSYLHYLAFHGD